MVEKLKLNADFLNKKCDFKKCSIGEVEILLLLLGLPGKDFKLL